ncbi:uncharacterized protein [Nicotiana sylvestris]|uniref:uncharacterized protein n=1 Tax=Nicotiana sylvestris TaxID=4096 RepID=UPI00388CE12F
MGSAPTILHGQERKESEELVAIQAQAAPITKTPADLALNEADMTTATRKFTFSIGIGTSKPTLTVVVQVWVNFPGLPIQYWTVENLGRIASSIGNPICTDKLTAQKARISYARMLIEMDVSQALPETMLIQTAERKIREQKLSYDWHPSFCQDYLTIGHDTWKCNGQTEMKKYTGPDAKGQIGGQKKRKKRITTKWIAKPKTIGEAQTQEARVEVNKEEPIAPPVINTEIEQKDNDFQIAKSKAKTGAKFQGEKLNEKGGLNKPYKQKELKVFLLKNKITVLGCLETKVKNGMKKELEGRLGLNEKYSQTIHMLPMGEYGYCGRLSNVTERQEIWSQIRQINSTMVEAWLIQEDFNTMISVNDRINGNPVHQSEVVDFQTCVDDIGLGLLNRKGCQWSWCNKIDGTNSIYCNIDWEDEFNKLVQEVGDQNITGYTMYSIWQKLQRPGSRAKGMNRGYNSVDKKVEMLKDQLQEVQKRIDNDLFNNTIILEEKELLMQVEKWQGIQENVYRQKSRAVWITVGDSNTKFFHRHLKARQARNRICTICNELGQKLTDPLLVEQQFISFFEDLLGTRDSELPCLDVNIARNGPCLNREQQLNMIKSVSDSEILQGLKELPSDKAPAIDGFPVEFFKKYWNIVGEEVIKAVKEFFESGKLMKNVCNATITLVPKVASPSFVKEFRPIAVPLSINSLPEFSLQD